MVEVNPFMVSQTIQNAARNRADLARLAQERQWAEEDRPMNQDLAQARLVALQNANAGNEVSQQTAQANLTGKQQANQQMTEQSVIQTGANLYKQIQANPEQAEQIYQNELAFQKSLGRDVSALPQTYDANAQQLVEGLYMKSQYGAQQDKSAGQREYEALVQAAQSDDPLIRQAARVKLRLDPGAVANAAYTAAQRGEVDMLANAEGQIAGSKEAAKLEEQLELEPRIESAVNSAKGLVEEKLEGRKVARDNAEKLDLYQSAMKDFIGNVDGTYTGPIAGFLPNISEDRQLLAASKVLLAPVIRSMFRVEGEGSQSDIEFKAFMALVPDEYDDNSVAKFKLQTLDNMVNAKFGYGENKQRVNAEQQNDTLSPTQPATVETQSNYTGREF